MESTEGNEDEVFSGKYEVDGSIFGKETTPNALLNEVLNIQKKLSDIFDGRPFSFIEFYRDFILRYVPTDTLWAESCAITTLAACINKFELHTRRGRLGLNVFILAIGPSGLANKTLPMKEFVIPTIRDVGKILTKKEKEKNKEGRVSLSQPSKFTVEYMQAHIARPGHNIGLIVRDEFTALLKESGKDYLRDIIEFLSEIYDCQIGSRGTIKRGLEEVPFCHISLLAATTPIIYRVMKPEFFLQGTGNRFLYCIFDKHNITGGDLMYYIREWGAIKERDEIRNLFARWLALLYQCNGTMVKPYVIVDAEGKEKTTDKIQKMMDKHTELKKTAMDMYDPLKPEDMTYSYIDRVAESMVKLAAIHVVGRRGPISISKEFDGEYLIFDDIDAEYALGMLDRYLDCFWRLMKQWNVTMNQREQYRIPASSDDLMEVMRMTYDIGGLISATEVRASLDIADREKVIRIFLLASEKGWLEVAAETGTQGSLTEEEYKRFKPKSGTSPRVYRITKKGVTDCDFVYNM